MSAWDRIRAWFVKENKVTTEVGPKHNRISQFESPWVRFGERKALWRDLQAMDRNEPIVHTAADFLARFSTTFTDDRTETGFYLDGPEDEIGPLGPLAAMLQADAAEFVRYMVKFGDLFAENIFDEKRNLRRVKMFPYSYQINVNTDSFGRMLTGDPAQAMRERKPGIAAYDQVDENGFLIAAFHPYQITQFSFGSKQGLPYAEPMMACIVSASKRLRAMRDGLSIARLDRAYQTRLHRIPVPKGLNPKEAQDKVDAYKLTMTKDLTIPYDTDTADFKLAGRETPNMACTDLYTLRIYTDDGKMIDGDVVNLPADNANLQNLEDVFLLVREVLCGTGVPADFLNLSVGQRAFIDKMSSERREGFLYLCASLSQAYLAGVKSILELQWLLWGKMPSETSYRVVGPRISPREAEIAAKIDLQRANTAVLWSQLGLPEDLIGSIPLQLSPEDIDKWIEARKEAAERAAMIAAGQEEPREPQAEEDLARWSLRRSI
jgi:hypothetical protein